MERRFSKENTNCIKGVAVLLLLLHHVLNSKYPYESILIGGTFDYLYPFVSLAKVCVYLFFIMSGYGLFISYTKEKRTLKNAFKFVIRHILKLWSMFWFVYIIFVPMGIFFDRSPSIIYAGDWLNALWDFLGLAYLTSHISCIPTWWYLSMSILFYAFFPFICLVIERLNKWSWGIWGIIVLLSGKYMGWKVSLIYCVPFLLGALLANFNGIEKIGSALMLVIKNKLIRVLIYFLMMCIYCVFRLKIMSDNMFFYRFDWILALLIILFLYDFVPTGGKVSKGMSLLGINSGNIYFFHAFIYSLYLKEFIYSFKYASLVYLITLAICIMVSRGLENLKSAIGYTNLFNRIIMKFS
ncbi:hypothetical protein DWX43_04120 [Clostridium sp. AF19-22AC]|uniref:acyltransferase family protein n=1 Tax=Clostridia TaxID=186801 RepID=UPI000E4F034A|nr:MULTISPECIES: acyltransferase family protein [Clostridia]RHR31847.1 hypothetical protein DWX43_04120 [Clostridium sp. AF19-22AC]